MQMINKQTVVVPLRLRRGHSNQKCFHIGEPTQMCSTYLPQSTFILENMNEFSFE